MALYFLFGRDGTEPYWELEGQEYTQWLQQRMRAWLMILIAIGNDIKLKARTFHFVALLIYRPCRTCNTK